MLSSSQRGRAAGDHLAHARCREWCARPRADRDAACPPRPAPWSTAAGPLAAATMLRRPPALPRSSRGRSRADPGGHWRADPPPRERRRDQPPAIPRQPAWTAARPPGRRGGQGAVGGHRTRARGRRGRYQGVPSPPRPAPRAHTRAEWTLAPRPRPGAPGVDAAQDLIARAARPPAGEPATRSGPRSPPSLPPIRCRTASRGL